MEANLTALGVDQLAVVNLRRALPVGIVCVPNAYSLVARADEEMLELCRAEGIAWVPHFPLGSAVPALPKVTDEPAVIAAAQAADCTPAQIGLAWILHHAPHTHLIPGTADAGHLQANADAGAVTPDEKTLAELDAIPARPARGTQAQHASPPSRNHRTGHH